MHQLLSLLRVIGNRMKFLSLSIKGCNVNCKGECTARLNNEWSAQKGSTINIGKHLSSLGHCRYLVRGGCLTIGDKVGLNSNCTIACHERIDIGEGTEIGPNVCIYDHDHDYKCAGGIKGGKFVTAPVIIGKNVWIGANAVILRGTTIGDHCVIAAGTVVSGEIPSHTLCFARRQLSYRNIEVKNESIDCYK